jgi:streptogramin lyase
MIGKRSIHLYLLLLLLLKPLANAAPSWPVLDLNGNIVFGKQVHVSGKVVALDGKTPHSNLVLELIQPQASTRENSNVSILDQVAPTAAPGGRPVPARRSVHLIHTNDWLNLPPLVFSDLTNVTLETWVTWDRFEGGRLYYYGEGLKDAGLELGWEGAPDFSFWICYEPGKWRRVHGGGPIQLRTWYHVAAVTGVYGMKLYVNGILVDSDATPTPFSVGPTGKYHFLGSIDPTWQGEQRYYLGEIDEMRVWKRERSADEIRSGMFEKLTGSEQDLIALWDFAEVGHPGRDASTNHFDGEIKGKPTFENTHLPAVLYGRITDPVGQPLAGASIELRQSGREVARFTANANAEYGLTIEDSQPADLFVTTGKFSAYRLGFRISGGPCQKLDWMLADTRDPGPLVLQNAKAAIVSQSKLRNSESQISEAFPEGTVIARVLTDENGAFDFVNVKPGGYQLRAQVLGGKAWYDGGRILYLQSDPSSKETESIKVIDFRLAPFKKGHWRSYDSSNGLPSNEIRKFWYDESDGSLWIATKGGVSRFDGKEFTNLTTDEGLLDDHVFNLWKEPSGIWWFCTARGVSRYDPVLAREGRSAFRNYTAQDGLAAGEIHAVAQTPDGTMWFGSQDSKALSRFDGEEFTTYPCGNVMKMTAGSDGLLWIGTWQGLFRFDGTNLAQALTSDGADSPDIAPDGSIWFGGGGLCRYDPNAVKQGRAALQVFTQKDGLLASPNATYRTGKNLWLATDRGVSLFDGNGFVHFTAADHLPSTAINTVAGTPDGVIWFGTKTAGILSYDPHHFAHFGVADGLVGPNSPPAWPTSQVGASLMAPDGPFGLRRVFRMMRTGVWCALTAGVSSLFCQPVRTQLPPSRPRLAMEQASGSGSKAKASDVIPQAILNI